MARLAGILAGCPTGWSRRPEARDHASGRLRAIVGPRLLSTGRFVASASEVGHKDIKMFSEDNRRIGARSIAQKFASCAEFRSYTDVVVDISALPRSLYMPLLASGAIRICDRAHRDRFPRIRSDRLQPPVRDAPGTSDSFAVSGILQMHDEMSREANEASHSSRQPK